MMKLTTRTASRLLSIFLLIAAETGFTQNTGTADAGFLTDPVSSLQDPASTTRNVKYWVYFTDKLNSPFSVERPYEFLSADEIERRRLQQIETKEMDLPVNENYIDGIKNTGAEIVVKSRWLNAVSVYASDEQLAMISQLPFVSQITQVKKFRHIQDDLFIPEYNNVFFRTNETASDYGGSFTQNHMIRVDYLHDLGYTGEGMRIAVLDAGFSGVDTGVGFQGLWEKSQILETRNFADDNDSVFHSSSHGSNVLSIMACDVPGTYIGSAPDAKYYLFRTEVSDSERLVEEDFWLEAAEYAEFKGAHIINSSLGYTTFDEASENHSYEDMDGNSTIVTKAADMAASVGILVCNSAGNEGNDTWKYISAPADGDSVFAIGSVNKFEHPSDFSSIGPTSDGRLKPNVVCQGEGTAVLDKSGYVYTGSGTSYSSPLMAGACASLWQAFPEADNMEIIDAVQKSADHFFNPNNKVGFGIPDFSIAYSYLQSGSPNYEVLNIYPIPVEDYFIIEINADTGGEAFIYIYDILGRYFGSYQLRLEEGETTKFVVQDVERLEGIFLISLQTATSTATKLITR